MKHYTSAYAALIGVTLSPKISAATVKEHHANMYAKLVDAAEEILRADGAAALKAGAVAKRAGIARNSIYRYVDSIDDLRVEVVERYIPRWVQAVDDALAGIEDPADRLIALTEVALNLADETGHRWLIDVMSTSRGISRPASAKKGAKEGKAGEKHPFKQDSILEFHRNLGREIVKMLEKIDPQKAEIDGRIMRSLIDTGMTALDDGLPLEDVKESVIRAVSALVK